MKIKTAELTSIALDYAVCEAAGLLKAYPKHRPLFAPHWARSAASFWYLHPSTNWACGGEIIERERIWLDCSWDVQWEASHPDNRHAASDGRTGWYDGPTPLIAAMRCYVASKLGDEVDIPDGIAQIA